MDALKNLIENLKEKLKASWAEQQESALFIQLKERYEELPAIAQKGVVWGSVALITIILLWWPMSNLMDASDFNSQFEERREMLKELLKIERDAASQPAIPPALPPSTFKTQFDQKIAAAGVRPEQIKEDGADVPTQNVSGAEKQGVVYRLEHLTVRQATDLAYELEHTDPSLRLDGLELAADQQDPHFYGVVMKIVNYAAKQSEPVNEPGKGIIDAIKNKSRPPTMPTLPPMPSIPTPPTGEASAIPRLGAPIPAPRMPPMPGFNK